MKKKFIEKWERYAPPGADVVKQINRFSGQILLAVFYTLICFLLRYLSARSNLYYFTGGQHILRPDAVMPDFTEMTAQMFLFHIILFLFLLGRIAGNYASFYRGSKSIYLMKRLPDPMECHRRCLALPQGDDYILLDEPFAGNDVFNREDFYKVLLGILEPSETVLLSTHLI